MDTFSWMTSLSVWLALAMTSFLVTSRVSLLWLLRLYKYEQIHPATWYLIVLILLQAPYISNGIHLLWNTPIISAASREALPKASRMALGVLSSILEGMATSIFATEVAHVLPEPVLLTLPYTILACVLLKVVLKDSQVQALKVSDASCLSFILDQVSKCIFLILACYTLWTTTAVAVVLCLWSQFRLSAEGCIVLITCVLLLSLAWSPTVQTMIVSNETGVRCRAIDLLYIPVKVIAVAVSLFMSLFFKLGDFRTYMIDCITLAFYEFSDIRVWLPVFICCLGAFFSLMSTVAASKMCLMKAGVRVPMFLCPVLSIFVTTIVWKDFETQAFRELAGEDLYSWIAIGISTVAWLIPFVMPKFDGFSNPSVCGRKFTEIFHSFSWSCFFLEPRLILIYDPSMVSLYRRSLSSQQTIRSRSKHVYICTTMYKESATEMKRYLGSINNVFTNNLNEALTLEAHIFFDSSVDNDKINRRGQHLISLLCETFQQENGDLEKLATPYGCQIRAKTPENYPVYVHFKDATKVKAKKRWSQVMYMHYILQFRTMYMKQQSRDNRSLIQSQSTEQCKKEYKRDIFLVGNYTGFHTSIMTNSFCTGVKYLPTKCHCASIPTPRNIDYIHLTSPSESTRSYGDVSDTTNCYCNECTSSDTSVRRTVASDRTCNNSNKLLESANSFDFNEDLELGKHTERPGPMYSRSMKPFSSTDESCATCSNSSDVCSIYTSADLDNSLDDFSKPGLRSSCQYAPSLLDDVFFVTTDADTEFSAKSIRHLLERCESEPGLGAVCGRTVPIGSAKPIVWYQKFEYAKDFWLVKSSQNVIGSVTCCPGCFSIYRGSAVASIADKFSQPADSAFDSLVMDHGEDRWLCTLLMQGGWRLAYTFQGCNSTHCPETVGEFLRQRRRWVLSELANMLAIFMSVSSLVKNNSAFSGMFLISLFTTFLWVILSPSTTLVFMCAGLDVLFSVSLIITLPISVMLFIGYCSVCCLASQRNQKLVSLTFTFAMALCVVTLGVGFIIYVATAVERDIDTWGCVQFQPYFLVFILVTCIVYAAVLHPRESCSLVYGLAYALIFPAMFVILPAYAIANMFDQSWGTRESGSHGCCQEPEEEEHDNTITDFTIVVSSLPSLACCNHEEEVFWKYLTSKYIGTDVNNRKPSVFLCNDLLRLRRLSVLIFVTVNLIWFCCLSALYVLAKSNAICYFVAAILSFSLVVQLIGLTCYKCNTILNTYFLSKSNVFVPRTLSH